MKIRVLKSSAGRPLRAGSQGSSPSPVPAISRCDPGRDRAGSVWLRSARAVLIGAGWLGFGLADAGLWAGEAIDFSARKTPALTAPVAPSLATTTKDKLPNLSRKPGGAPRDVLDPGAYVGNQSEPRLSKKEEKKLQNERLEKESWILTDRGELQEKEAKANDFGVREYGDGIEKEKTAADIWFGPKQANSSKDGRSQSPSPAAARSGATARPAPPVEDSPAEPKLKLGKDSDALLAGPGVKETKLPTLLPAEPTDAPLKDLFGGPTAGASTGSALEGRNARRDEVGLRSGPSFGEPGSSSPGLSKGIGLGRETALAAPSPTSPLLDSPARSVGLGSSPVRMGDPLSSGGFGLGNSARLGGPGTFGSPSLSPFSSPGGLNNNSAPRNDGLPSLGRGAFESSPRSPLGR